MTEGTLFVITGPSGAGKGTVLSRTMERVHGLHISVSVTTRRPRQGEEHGVHYYFAEKEEFEDLIARDMLLEYAEYVGNYYGTPAEAVAEKLAEGKDVILEIETQGAMQIKRRCSGAKLVFIMPPSFEELEKRLRGRGTETDDVIFRRMRTAREECRRIAEFDYLVINDDADIAADELRSIIVAARCLTERRAPEFTNIF